ncbi:MAG: hypothetical protein H0U16_13330, partial [Actinobacteria bacterium]|nr:hypothetical protein [Actinomycetota bacterium]
MGSEPSVEGSEAGGAEEGSEARRADAIERVGRTSGPVMAAGALAVVAAVVAAYVGLAHWGLAESS